MTVRRRTATYPRALRVNQVLRQVLAEELERLGDADELPMVTITSVEVAADMRTAVVYLASLDESTADALEEQRGHLQHVVGTQMTMKRTPRLRFTADPAIAAGFECGIGLSDFQDLKEGDIIETFEEREIARS